MIYGSTFQYKDTGLSLVNIISGTTLDLQSETKTYFYILQGEGTLKSTSIRSYHKLDLYHVNCEETSLSANSDSVILMVNAATELKPDIVKVLGRQVSALKYSTKVNISALSSYLTVSSRLKEKYGISVRDFTRLIPSKAERIKSQSSELFKMLLKELRSTDLERK